MALCFLALSIYKPAFKQDIIADNKCVISSDVLYDFQKLLVMTLCSVNENKIVFLCGIVRCYFIS